MAGLDFYRKRRLRYEFGQAARFLEMGGAGAKQGLREIVWMRKPAGVGHGVFANPGRVFERRCRFGVGAGLSSWKRWLFACGS